VLLDVAASERLSKRIAAAGLEVEVLCGTAELERVSTLPEVDAVMAAISVRQACHLHWRLRRRARRYCWRTRRHWCSPGTCSWMRVRRSGSALLPIDSEHNAIFQALPRGYAAT